MPKRRQKAKPESRRQKAKRGQPSGKRFLRFIISPPIRNLILIIIVIGLLYWFQNPLLIWSLKIWESLLALLGAGLALIAITIVVLIWIIRQQRFSVFWQRWNWWCGGIALALAVWGLFAFFTPGEGVLKQATLGGSFGRSIIHAPDIIGGLRLGGLVFLGLLFIAPKRTWRAIVGIAKALGQACRASWQYFTKIVQTRHKIAPKPAARDIRIQETKEAAPKEEIVSVAPVETTVAETWQKFERHQPVITAGGWQLPPIDILDKVTEIELSQADIEKRAELLEEALVSYGVQAKVVQINVGPTVTQFGVEPGWDRKYKEIKEKDKDGNIKIRLQEVSKTRVKVDRIASLANDLALALAAPTIRIEAPVPGKSVVGIEVPNTTFSLVGLRSVIETASFQKIKARSKLALALGKGAGGETVAADLTRMPHLLIAGATGSGKTVCLNSVISCLLVHNTPDDVQFIMVDPKRVELISFNGIPHLAAPVVVDTDKAIMALRWLNQEMDNRYRKFAEAGARNIDGYNKEREAEETLPYLVLVIDELADLMMTAFDEVEHTLCRLAQLARATGIHLIVATQRPSVDVVTGLIKANFPTRISFAVTSQVDSRTILDTMGAEKLLGRGDMLFMPTEATKPKRLQGTFVSDAEIEKLVYFWGKQQRPETRPIRFEEAAQPSFTLAEKLRAEDPLLDAARNLSQEHKHISVSFLQRRLRIGYPRAARLMETLEQEGYKRVNSIQE